MDQPISSKTSTPDRPSDADLVNRARSGAAEAFDELIVRYQDRVYNMSLRMLGHREDALDVSQEIFLTVFRSLEGFASQARFSTWLYRVTVNRCRDELRRRGTVKHTRPLSLDARRAGADDERTLEPSASGASPEQRAVAHETGAMVEAAMAELPEDAREVMVLRDIQDLSYDRIADVLEIPVGTVRSRLNRARMLLRDRLRPILELES